VKTTPDAAPVFTELHETIKTQGEKTEFFVFIVSAGNVASTYNALFCHVEAANGITPEQVAAFLITNKNIGYSKSLKAFMYVLDADRVEPH